MRTISSHLNPNKPFILVQCKCGQEFIASYDKEKGLLEVRENGTSE